LNTELVPIIKDFMKKEKIDFSIMEENSSEFWINDKNDSITVRFMINKPQNEIFYDVYSPKLIDHLQEGTIKDFGHLDLINEENGRGNMAEIIEDTWLILDEIKIWARENNFKLKEKQLI